MTGEGTPSFPVSHLDDARDRSEAPQRLTRTHTQRQNEAKDRHPFFVFSLFDVGVFNLCVHDQQ